MSYIKHLEDNLVDIIKIFILTFILVIINLVIVLICTKGYIKDNPCYGYIQLYIYK